MRPTLPGCVRALNLDPVPRWPIALRNTRALHGVLTGVVGGHADRNCAAFALIPWPHDGDCCGWAMQTLQDLPLAARHAVNIFGQNSVLTLGPRVRMRTPARHPAGVMHTLCLDTVTPICIRTGQRDGSAVYHCEPREDGLLSAMRQSRWMAAAIGEPPGDPSLHIVGGRTSAQTIPVGESRAKRGSWNNGVIIGWAGRVLIQCDSQARWLLEVASQIGLGGRISLGFGRFTLREVAP